MRYLDFEVMQSTFLHYKVAGNAVLGGHSTAGLYYGNGKLFTHNMSFAAGV